MLCEILKVGELRKSPSARSTALQVYCCLWFFISLQFALPYPQIELNTENRRNKMSSGTALPTEMQKLVHAQIRTCTDTYLKYTNSPPLLRWKQPLCSVIVLLGVHYLVMHLTPFKPFQPNIPPLRSTLCGERDAVLPSTPNWCALFICLYLFKWASWSQFCCRLTPAAPCGEGDGILHSVLSWCALFICLFFSFFSPPSSFQTWLHCRLHTSFNARMISTLRNFPQVFLIRLPH